eukprot:UN15607
MDEKIDEIAKIAATKLNPLDLFKSQQSVILSVKTESPARIDSLVLFGGDITNIFVSMICCPIFIPTGFNSDDKLIAPFFT